MDHLMISHHIIKMSDDENSKIKQEAVTESPESTLDGHSRVMWGQTNVHAAPKTVSKTAKLRNHHGSIISQTT